MAEDALDAADVLRDIWRQTPSGIAEFDAECSPTKACRNMRDITFEGFAEEGGDVAAAWRNTLDREGKRTGSSLADLIHGEPQS